MRHVVVGARQMGGGIAQVVAASGRRVSLYDPFINEAVSNMEVLEQGLGDEKYAPHPLLREHVAAGRLGRKSGAGFFEYR